MENLKVYLDTSVISHLLQEDVPEKMADTRKLWEKFKAGQYDVYLSTVTLEEISDCKEPITKDMTPQERRDYYNKRGMKVHKQIQYRCIEI